MTLNALCLTVLRTSEVGCSSASPAAFIETGSNNIDTRLGGGLARAALHEVFADDGDHSASAAGFALMMALRGCAAKPVIWVREDRGERNNGRLYASGLVELGADPTEIILVTGADALTVLRAGADIVACGAVGAVVIEPWGKAPALDHTVSRRLALAAARSGVLTLVLRTGATPAPSAAATRWSVRAAPSAMLAASAPGRPAFDINLLRHRGGIAGFEARVEWNRDRRSFCDAPLPGGVPAAAPRRAATDFGRRAA